MIGEPGGWGWRHHAGCVGVDPEVFFPVYVDGGGPAVAVAKRVCAGCPVRSACLADVMVAEDPARRWGVIAGLTPDERRDLFAASRPVPCRAGAVAA